MHFTFGCMSLPPDQHTVTALLSEAIDLGVKRFDTADLYQEGKNEEMVGVALKEKRKNVFIATKVGNQLRADGSGWDWNPKKEYILTAVDASLCRLHTDYIDLYQLHGGTIEDPIDETIEAFETLKQQGKILAYGISSIRPNVIREWINRSNMVSVMMQYSLLDRRAEESCLDLLKMHGIEVLVRGSIAKGLLAGKPQADFQHHSRENVQRIVDMMQTAGTPLSHTAVQYVLHHPAVSSVVGGVRTSEQLRDFVAAVQADAISEELLLQLRQVATPEFYQEHR